MSFNAFRLRIPATSANIGAGFDCMGLALKLYNFMEFTPSDRLEIITDKDLPKDENNLVVRTIKKVFESFKADFMPFRMVQTNNIPCASGLGSSAACIVGGTMAANIMLGSPMSKEKIIEFCTLEERHPDNVVPAITGGISAGVITDEEVIVKTVIPKKMFKLATFTPEFELLTEHSRRILPKDYLRGDVVFNCQRAIITFKALEDGDMDLLDRVVSDRIHEPYRLPLIKYSTEIIASMRASGIKGVFLSGAGPTIAGFVPLDYDQEPQLEYGTFRVLELDTEGAKQMIANQA